MGPVTRGSNLSSSRVLNQIYYQSIQTQSTTSYFFYLIREGDNIIRFTGNKSVSDRISDHLAFSRGGLSGASTDKGLESGVSTANGLYNAIIENISNIEIVSMTQEDFKKISLKMYGTSDTFVDAEFASLLLLNGGVSTVASTNTQGTVPSGPSVAPGSSVALGPSAATVPDVASAPTVATSNAWSLVPREFFQPEEKSGVHTMQIFGSTKYLFASSKINTVAINNAVPESQQKGIDNLGGPVYTPLLITRDESERIVIPIDGSQRLVSVSDIYPRNFDLAGKLNEQSFSTGELWDWHKLLFRLRRNKDELKLYIENIRHSDIYDCQDGPINYFFYKLEEKQIGTFTKLAPTSNLSALINQGVLMPVDPNDPFEHRDCIVIYGTNLSVKSTIEIEKKYAMLYVLQCDFSSGSAGPKTGQNGESSRAPSGQPSAESSGEPTRRNGSTEGKTANSRGGTNTCTFVQEMSHITTENVLEKIGYGTGKAIQRPVSNPYASPRITHSDYYVPASAKIMTEWQLGENQNSVEGKSPSIQAGEKLYSVLTAAHSLLADDNAGRKFDAYSVLKDMCQKNKKKYIFDLYPIGYARYILDFECRSWYLMIFAGSKRRATWMPLEMINFLCWNHPEIMRYLTETGVDLLTQVHTATNGVYSEGVPYIGWHVNPYGDRRFNTVSRGYPLFAMSQRNADRKRKMGTQKKCAMQLFGCGCRQTNDMPVDPINYEYVATKWHEDHVVPLNIHGRDAAFNKQELCETCHDKKTNYEGVLDFNKGSEPVPLMILAGYSLYSMCLCLIHQSRNDEIEDDNRKKLLDMAGFDMNNRNIIDAPQGTSLVQSHGSNGAVPVDFKPIAQLVSGKTFEDVISQFKSSPNNECVNFMVNHFKLRFQASSRPSLVLTWRQIIDNYVNPDERSYGPNDYRPYTRGRPTGIVDGTVTFNSEIIP